MHHHLKEIKEGARLKEQEREPFQSFSSLIVVVNPWQGIKRLPEFTYLLRTERYVSNDIWLRDCVTGNSRAERRKTLVQNPRWWPKIGQQQVAIIPRLGRKQTWQLGSQLRIQKCPVGLSSRSLRLQTPYPLESRSSLPDDQQGFGARGVPSRQCWCHCSSHFKVE